MTVCAACRTLHLDESSAGAYKTCATDNDDDGRICVMYFVNHGRS
jgi:hypothetical protein